MSIDIATEAGGEDLPEGEGWLPSYDNHGAVLFRVS